MITYEEPNKIIDVEVDDVCQDIISDIPMEYRLDQLADEASELSKAALKVSRILRKEESDSRTYKRSARFSSRRV